MSADFDKAAHSYDEAFTYTNIGKRQRHVVWRYVDQLLAKSTDKQSILEINCGTGEDALHFGQARHQVLATDISEKMLTVTNAKCHQIPNVTTSLLDLTDPQELDQQFDLIFSNFGGLNCLDVEHLEQFASWARRHLSRNGHIIMVIMPRDTYLEKWYRRYKGDKSSIDLRQSTRPTKVHVNSQNVYTYFYNPSEIERLFQDMSVETIQATGFVPSYWSGHRLESLLLSLSKLSQMVGLAPRFGDHYLMHLKN